MRPSARLPGVHAMRVSAYLEFIDQSDKFKDRDPSERVNVALYGLAGEVGSVVAAIKKRLIAENGADWRISNEEIEEELGDSFWYCFLLARISHPNQPFNILAESIRNLKAEIGAEDERALLIKQALDPAKRDTFLTAAAAFPEAAEDVEFEDYQKLAYLTARTEPKILVEVCLAVLWQLIAELLRCKLPKIEFKLNRTLPDRPIDQVLGEIVWHLSALASLYNLKLSDIVLKNIKKIDFRRNRGLRTLLHDRRQKPPEQLPRHFEIAFVTFANGKARMYYEGRRLGDPLTDNAYGDDGYRYHDVMHLANAAVLGWSPVLRKLLGRKRRSDPKKDEVEDGARAQIVEEAVIKAIHSEGVRLAKMNSTGRWKAQTRLFPNRNDISFRFLNLVRNFVDQLEVNKNNYWEWEDAIFYGHEVFDLLRCEGQGTITVDLTSQCLSFRPDVCIELSGVVAGLGSSVQPLDTPERRLRSLLTATENERSIFPDAGSLICQVARKSAILDALGFINLNPGLYRALDVIPLDETRISVRARGEVQKALWTREVVRVRTTLARGAAALHCTAMCVADPSR